AVAAVDLGACPLLWAAVVDLVGLRPPLFYCPLSFRPLYRPYLCCPYFGPCSLPCCPLRSCPYLCCPGLFYPCCPCCLCSGRSFCSRPVVFLAVLGQAPDCTGFHHLPDRFSRLACTILLLFHILCVP